MDGKAAAFAVLHSLGQRAVECECVPMDYGKPFPLNTICNDEPIWIVDFSIDPKEMNSLLQFTGNVIWIDHHKTAIEKYADFPTEIAGVREDGVAGCVLTWRYCNPDEPLPRMIELVGDRDVWTWAFGKETANFHAGAAMCDTQPKSIFWKTMLNDSHQFVRVLDQGSVINAYKSQHNADVLKRIGFEAYIDGHKCLCMNACSVGSEAFGDGAMGEYAILSPFYWDGQQFSVSLYSSQVDVSEIAKARGGGGHKGAAGFQCDVLPYEPANSGH